MPWPWLTLTLIKPQNDVNHYKNIVKMQAFVDSDAFSIPNYPQQNVGRRQLQFQHKNKHMFDRLLMLLQATVHIYLMNIILKALKLSIKISTLYKLWVTRWKSKLFLLSQVDWTTPQIIFDWLSVSCICSNSSKLISLLSCQDHTAYIQSPSQYVIQHFQIN